MTLFNDQHFSRCRQALGVDATILADFQLASFGEGGGKGGEPMAFTADRRYIVKKIAGGD